MPSKRPGFLVTFHDVHGQRHTVRRTSTKRHLEGSCDVLARFRTHKTCTVEGKSHKINHRALVYVRPEGQEEVTDQQPGL